MVGAIWSRKFLTTSHEVGRSQEMDRPYGDVANDFPILMSKKLLEFSYRVLASPCNAESPVPSLTHCLETEAGKNDLLRFRHQIITIRLVIFWGRSTTHVLRN